MRSYSVLAVLIPCVVLLGMAGPALAGEPCHHEKCNPPPAVVVTIAQPMPGPRASPGVTVKVPNHRGPVPRVLGWLWRPGLSIVVR